MVSGGKHSWLVDGAPNRWFRSMIGGVQLVGGAADLRRGIFNFTR